MVLEAILVTKPTASLASRPRKQPWAGGPVIPKPSKPWATLGHGPTSRTPAAPRSPGPWAAVGVGKDSTGLVVPRHSLYDPGPELLSPQCLPPSYNRLERARGSLDEDMCPLGLQGSHRGTSPLGLQGSHRGMSPSGLQGSHRGMRPPGLLPQCLCPCFLALEGVLEGSEGEGRGGDLLRLSFKLSLPVKNSSLFLRKPFGGQKGLGVGGGEHLLAAPLSVQQPQSTP